MSATTSRKTANGPRQGVLTAVNLASRFGESLRLQPARKTFHIFLLALEAQLLQGFKNQLDMLNPTGQRVAVPSTAASHFQ
jgi:hypothetical protein